MDQFGHDGIVITIAYCAIGTFIILKLVGLLTRGLRVTSDEEREGLDIVLHGESVA
jgi:ammonium transporter, Amt family